MVSAILFDFGGTLDADGLHWLDRFYRIYEQIGLSTIPKDNIKEAFYWADAQADHHPSMSSADLRAMMELHVHWQFEKLKIVDAALEQQAVQAFVRPAERILRRNRHILETLNYAGLKLGVVSNFYGNIEALCREFRYLPFIHGIFDSAVVGLKKPDPRFFEHALARLGIVRPQDAAFVGDSFERDMLPAKSVGMITFWLLGDQRKTAPDPSKVDRILLSLEDLPREFPAPEAGR